MNIGFMCGHVCRDCAWIRLFGYGVAVRKSNAFPPLFSERNGKRKVYSRSIGLAIEFLKPTPFD